MARPLLHMSEATRRIVRGDLDIDLSGIRRKDEVGQLAQAFTRMAAGLQTQRKLLMRFLNILDKFIGGAKIEDDLTAVIIKMQD